jgi:3-phosphoshikimate 1-carboxyvinyltransferase
VAYAGWANRFMSEVQIKPVIRPFVATVTPPGSKSLTNRALVLAAMAEGVSTLANVLFADDTLVMLDGLGRLGFELFIDRAGQTVRVHGAGGRVPAHGAELFCGNSGTTIRFLSALCALGRGDFVLDGVARMRQRPIRELLDKLRNLGVRAGYVGEEGFPPVKIHAHGVAGGIIRFGAAASSQYLSAILMVAPYARHELSVDLDGGQTSWPYVAMTMRIMDEFGVLCELIRDPESGEPRRIVVPAGVYAARDYAIEPDASNASYFLAAAAIHAGSRVTIAGLGGHSLQGDVGFAEVLKEMGAEVSVLRDSITVAGTGRWNGIDVDLSAMPDTAQTLAVAAIFADGPTIIRGLRTLRVKETDRLAALSAELGKLGAQVEIEGDALKIEPPRQARAAEIDTYDDHRMAMSFSLAATKIGGVVIRDAECVGKTYPNYFDDLRRMLAGG